MHLILPVCAGAGGLSHSLCHAGVIDRTRHWAVENWKPAAKSYHANHPDATVIEASCEAALAAIHRKSSAMDELQLVCDEAAEEEAATLSPDMLPGCGEIEFVAAGPPCQVRFGTCCLLKDLSQFINRHMLAIAR